MKANEMPFTAPRSSNTVAAPATAHAAVEGGTQTPAPITAPGDAMMTPAMGARQEVPSARPATPPLDATAPPSRSVAAERTSLTGACPVAANGADAAATRRQLTAARTALRVAQRALSGDGRLVLAALTEKIARDMASAGAQARAEVTRFAASALVRKEQAEGPVILSTAQRRALQALERTMPPASPMPARPHPPEAPRLTR
ncbi:hypothetical protein M5E06_32715 [Azospirillum sp. A1-3]|uniref:hypothetical protein n=1 Tax=Azospirillum sp. A1-3 TaxID=185874 RepID=UPI0020770F6C|nr:hypothetical protein [Azospirillum sp. A1-3]MCM8738854.1 hypothetical protein [Azospirillum sp. A1-3]